MYLDDYTLTAASHKKTTSMSAERSSTITIASPANSPPSSHKPSFRIALSPNVSLLGLAIGKSEIVLELARPWFGANIFPELVTD
jgi:hypothetical protein